MEGGTIPGMDVFREYLEKESSQMIALDPCHSRMAELANKYIKWIPETIVTRLKMRHITAYLATNYFNRALCSDLVLGNEHEYKILPMTCSFLAIKLEEIYNDCIEHSSLIEDFYEWKAMISMERAVLDKLDWNLIVVTPYTYEA